MELTFFIAAHPVLCFGFMARRVLITHYCLGCCLHCQCSRFPTLPPQQLGWSWARELQRDKVGTADPSWPEGCSMPSTIKLFSKNCSSRRRVGLPSWLLFRDWLGIDLPVWGGEWFPLIFFFFLFFPSPVKLFLSWSMSFHVFVLLIFSLVFYLTELFLKNK